MSEDGRRALIAAGRRVVFTGLIILGAWVLLVGLRGAAVATTAESMAEEAGVSQEAMTELLKEGDWSRSWWTDKSVAEEVGLRLGITLQLVALGGVMALVVAAALLFLGAIIGLVTDRPPWLAKIRQVLRMVLVSSGVAYPVFFGTQLLMVYGAIWWEWSPPVGQGITWWPVFFVSMPITWLLVQSGHGVLADRPGGTASSYRLLARDIAVKLVTTLLKLVGALFVVAMLMEQMFALPGLWRLFLSSIFTRDYPVVFGAAWTFVIIVVLVKLAADLIEIAYNHFGGRAVTAEPAEEQPPLRRSIPRAWLIVSLVLVLASVVVAVVVPALAPYDYNEIHMADRLAPPGADYRLGTDSLGRDIFSRLLYGIRVDIQAAGMMVGMLVIVAAGFGIAGAALRRMDNWLGDTLEDLVMLPRDILCAFPWLMLLILLMSVVGVGLVQVAMMAGLVVLLPRAVGMMREAYSSPPDGRGWLYSVLWSIPVMMMLAMAGGILYTSTLSFLGLGIPPPQPELGRMLSAEGRRYMLQAPWMARWPGIPLVLLILVWVMAGDALLERLGFRSKAVWAKVVE